MTRPLGIGLFGYLLVLLTGALCGVMSAAVVAAGMALFFVLHKRARPSQKMLCVVLVVAAAGAVQIHDIRAIEPAKGLDRAEAFVVGTVKSNTMGTDGAQHLVLRTESVTADGVVSHPATRIAVTLYDEPRHLQPGDRVSFSAKLFYSPDLAAEKWLARYDRSRNVLITAKNPNGLLITRGRLSLLDRLALYREKLAARLPSPLARAMLFGDRSALTERQQTVFERTGMSHVLTFSGMHFSSIAAALLLLLSLFGFHKRQTAWVLMAVTLFLMALMGFTPSVSRAGVMLLMSCLATLLFRQADGLTSLAVAGFLICFGHPYLVESTGFLLGFFSVFGILLLAQPLTELFASLLHAKSRLLYGICAMSALTISALFATMPVLMGAFGELTVLALPANLLTYYPIMLLMALGVLDLVFPLPPVAAMLGTLEQFCMGILTWLSNFQSGTLYADAIGVWIVYLSLFALLAVCFFYREKRPDFRPAFFCAFGIVAAAIVAAPPAHDALCVAFFDVGQGASVLVHDGGKSVLIDCGSISLLQPEETILQALHARGVFDLDAVIITHAHIDHMSALEGLAKEISIGRLILSQVTRPEEPLFSIYETGITHDIPIERVDSLRRMQLGKTVLTVCAEHILDLPERGLNDCSLLIRIDRGESSVLITGDMERSAETDALSSDACALLLDADVLSVAHHGADTSSTPAFLLAVRPAISVISVGQNDYGHPAPSVLERLYTLSPYVLLTREQGTVELTTTGDGRFAVHTVRRAD
ncbi:MAG: ComEC/Rec2 family competence protein [Clostridia bacterium]|nr:ComEC/Rec2 family competence protein [Clostridia bacterium]